MIQCFIIASMLLIHGHKEPATVILVVSLFLSFIPSKETWNNLWEGNENKINQAGGQRKW